VLRIQCCARNVVLASPGGGGYRLRARSAMSGTYPATAGVDRVQERHRAAALARHYRDQEGLPVAEIARRLGRARATVKAYLYDPTGEKARAVKRRYQGVCRGCGAPTTARGGKGDAYGFCKRCNGCPLRLVHRGRGSPPTLSRFAEGSPGADVSVATSWALACRPLRTACDSRIQASSSRGPLGRLRRQEPTRRVASGAPAAPASGS